VVLTTRGGPNRAVLKSCRPCSESYTSENDADSDATLTVGAQRSVREQRRLDPDQILSLVTEYVQGQSVAQLSRSWRIHRAIVMDHLEHNEVPRRPTGRKTTDNQVKQANASYQVRILTPNVTISAVVSGSVTALPNPPHGCGFTPMPDKHGSPSANRVEARANGVGAPSPGSLSIDGKVCHHGVVWTNVDDEHFAA